jgi:two-component system phosphate regulon response regulator PhoB
VRSVVYRFDDLAAFRRALQPSPDDASPGDPPKPLGAPVVAAPGPASRELELPGGERVGDGEWVLAIFEIGAGRKATAAAARGTDRGSGPETIAFERRDWERLCAFAEESRAPPPSDDAGPPSADPTLRDLGAYDRQSSPPSSSAPGSLGGHPPTPGSHRPSRDEPVTLSASGRHAAAPGARVLVVDDDESTREMVSAMLEAVGLNVFVTDTAEEALALVRAEPFHLIVLDWSLPRMTGLELCREIRREPYFTWLPVLFLTANTSQKDLVEAFASGADDYMLKPFRAPELGARIFSLLRRARIAKGAAGASAASPPAGRRRAGAPRGTRRS